MIGEPQFKATGDQLQTFDFVVANPPFSAKAWGSGLSSDVRPLRLGMPPDKNGDFAFLLHILGSMKAPARRGHPAPRRALPRQQGGELRKEILKRGYIKAIIGLPANLFYGTGIPASIIVLDKEPPRPERPSS